MTNKHPLPDTLVAELHEYDISDCSEVALREALEEHASTYTLFKLADWPARRWHCRYRLMMGEGVYDAQSVPEAYARALLALLKGT